MSEIISAIIPFLKAGGGLIMVLGGIITAVNLPQHNGPGIQNGLLVVVSGAIIVALAPLLSNYVA